MALEEDYLPNHKNIKIIQDDEMFKLNSDTAFLGEFFNFNDNQTILDIGTNNGALLLYALVKAYGKLFGIDINSKALELAKINLKKYTDDFELFNIDAKNYINEKVDVIVSNPPYFALDASCANKNVYFEMAKREKYLLLDDLFLCVKNNLKNDGTFYLIHKIHREKNIKNCCIKYGLYINRIRYINDIRCKKIVSVLFEISYLKSETIIETINYPTF